MDKTKINFSIYSDTNAVSYHPCYTSLNEDEGASFRCVDIWIEAERMVCVSQTMNIKSWR